MWKPTFRVKRYANAKYKFLVRGKVSGKWKRRYFATESEAIAFADQQNALDDPANRGALSEPTGAGKVVPTQRKPSTKLSRPDHTGITKELSKLISPAYLGPRIERYIGDSWCMHLPFAYDLMREFAPKVFVELGVKEGESYFAFCQSAAENKINVKCYGVDSWRGDIQTGTLDPKIQEDIINYNWRYSSFSELKAKLFTEAVDDFADASIELLHIDGTHTYRGVKSDFASWLPKVAPGGLVLFHDVMMRDGGFGVWKLWEEIARDDNSFLFEFGFGLGVWKKGPVASDSSFVRRLFLASPAERRIINEFYANAAAALALWHNLARQYAPEKQAARFPTEAEDRTTEIARFEREAEIRARQAAQSQRDLEAKSRQVVELKAELQKKTDGLAQVWREAQEKSEQLIQFQRELDAKTNETEAVRRELGEKTQIIIELRATVERNSNQLALLKQEIATAAGQMMEIKREVSEKSTQVIQLERDLQESSNKVTFLQRQNDQQAQLIEELKNQVERSTGFGDEFLDTQWENLTLRSTFLRETFSAETTPARVLQLQTAIEAIKSEREHLRAMVAALQKDLEEERSVTQTKEDQFIATQAQLQEVEAELHGTKSRLRNVQTEMKGWAESFWGRFLLRFGKLRGTFQEFTADHPAR
jgi:archaellum component FlaC